VVPSAYADGTDAVPNASVRPGRLEPEWPYLTVGLLTRGQIR